MHLGMSMGLSQSLEHRQELTQRQSLELRQSQRLALRLDLLGAINEGNFKPQGDCPKCHRKLTHLEILNGFNQDPNDFTTRCSGCGHRFEPRLIWSTGTSRTELPYFCGSQTLAQMRELASLPPQEVRREHPTIYYSARCHFGTLKNAFQRIGVEYSFDDVDESWQRKVTPFLGKLADTVIAGCVGVPVGKVRALRREKKIVCAGAKRKPARV